MTESSTDFNYGNLSPQTRINVERLKEKLGKIQIQCPICHGGKFLIVDGFVFNPVRPTLDSPPDNSVVPSVVLVCENCGFLSQHSLAILDPEAMQNANESK